MPRLTEEQKRFLYSQRNNRHRKWVALKCGCSEASVKRYAQMYGGEFGSRGDMPMESLYPELEEIVRKKYLTTPVTDIAREVGCSRALVRKRAKQLGIVRTKEQQADILKIQYQKVREIWAQEEIKKKKVERIRTAHRMERFREISGMPPKTLWRKKNITHKAAGAKYHLRNKYGYEADPTDAYALVVTKTTKRCEREQYFLDKYHFHLVLED